jgi:hypothetical protein
MRSIVAVAVALAATSLAAAAPKIGLVLGATTVTDGLEVAAVTAKLARVTGKLRACFAAQPLHGARGGVQLELAIRADGKVSKVRAVADAIDDDDDARAKPVRPSAFEACIAKAVGALRFARAKARPTVHVTQRLDFVVEADCSAPGTCRGGGGSGGGGDARTATTEVPRMKVGAFTSKGPLDHALLHRYIRRNEAKLQYCYEKVLLVKPGIGGTLIASFRVTPAGGVAGANAAGVDPDVASCVTGVLAGIEFPRPRTEVVVDKLPLVFAPSAPAK